MILFDLAVHLGTSVAVVVYFQHSIRKYLRHLFGSLSGLDHPVDLYQRSASIRFSALAATAIVITVLFYVFFHNRIKEGFEKPRIVAICWLITATFLLLTDFRGRGRRGLKQFGLICAVLVGLAQGAALFPGISRSGATICAATLLGLRRRWAGEFSFLIGIPAILGASLIEGIRFFASDTGSLVWGPTILAVAVSAVVGWAALSLLIWALRKARMRYFAFYCYIIAVITLIML